MARLRGDNALTLDGNLPALNLDDFFALNPAMPNLHRTFEAREAITFTLAPRPKNRDLKPTTDLRAVLKGALRDHLHAEEKALAQTVFPGSEAVKPMTGLVG